MALGRSEIRANPAHTSPELSGFQPQAQQSVQNLQKNLARAGAFWSNEPPMHLSPREQEKLLVVMAADLARRRQQRGLKLNYPEAVANVTYEIMEGARDGKSVAELMSYGTTIIKRSE